MTIRNSLWWLETTKQWIRGQETLPPEPAMNSEMRRVTQCPVTPVGENQNIPIADGCWIFRDFMDRKWQSWRICRTKRQGHAWTMNQFWDVFWTCFYLPTITSDLILGWSFPGPHKQIKYPPPPKKPGTFKTIHRAYPKWCAVSVTQTFPARIPLEHQGMNSVYPPQHCHKPFSANSALENHHDQHANHLQRGESSISQSVYVNLFLMRCMYIQICRFMKYIRFWAIPGPVGMDHLPISAISSPLSTSWFHWSSYMLIALHSWILGCPSSILGQTYGSVDEIILRQKWDHISSPAFFWFEGH